MCGGNDAEKKQSDNVIDDYEGLIKDVRRQCPESKIFLSSIPPRKNNKVTLKRIREINDYLKDRGRLNDDVYYIDVAPKARSMFRKDNVHFNKKGLNAISRNLKAELPNFSRLHTHAHT